MRHSANGSATVSGNRSVARVEKIIAGGFGLVRDCGVVVFCPPGTVVPGDEIEFRTVRGYRKTFLAEDIDVTEPAPERRTPACPHFLTCGGCDLMHMSESRQSSVKLAILEESLRRLGGIDTTVLPHTEYWTVPPFGYRNRVQIHTDSGFGGFRPRSGAGIVAIDRCPVTDESLQRFFGFRTPYAARVQAVGPGMLNETAAVVLEDNTPGNRGWKSIDGERDAVDIDILGTRVRAHAGGFFQSSFGGLGELASRIRDAASDRAEAIGEAPWTALELYCGSGILGSFLPPACERILGVDIDPYPGDVYGPRGKKTVSDTAAFLRRISADYDPAGIRFLLADPPRSGLDSAVLAFLSTVNIPVLALVFCDPASAGRDIGGLLRIGYRVDTLTVLDFYPQTHHFETLAVLVKDGR